MRGLIGICLGLLCGGAVAAEAPAFYQNVKGTLVTGLFERGTIDFTGGALSNCTRNDATGLVLFKCDVSGTSVAISANGKALTFSPTKVTVFYKRQRDARWVREYHFPYTFEEAGRVPLHSNAELTLWHYDNELSEIKGSFQLTDYGVFGAVQASGAQR